AQRRLRKADRHPAEQVVAVTFQKRMPLDPHVHVQIAAPAAVLAGLAFARHADALAVVDSRGDVNGQDPVPRLPAGPFAALAGRDDQRPLAPAIRAGRDNPSEKRTQAGSLLHLSVTAAGGAVAPLRSRLAAAA